MSELSSFVDQQMKTKGWSLRAAEEETGVSRSALDNIIKDTQRPEPDTLIKLGNYFSIPLWRLMEMAGYDLGFGDALLAQRVASLISRIPALTTVFDQMLQLPPDRFRNLVQSLEGLLISQQRDLERSQQPQESRR